MIEIENLDIRLATDRGEVHAVRNVSLSVGVGERLAIVGESGSGKSTLLLAMLGLLPPTARVSGRVVVDGVDVLRGPEADLVALRWKRAAMVFQASSNPLNPVRSIGAQLVGLLRLHGVSRAEAPGRMRELLAMARLPEGCDRAFPHQLSGGMRQRAVIAFALACRPRILLADEPTTALDPIVQAEIIELLLDLTGTLGLALVLVSHDLQMVRRGTGRLAVMYGGEIVEHGPVDELMRAPRHPHLRTLIAALPEFGAARQEAG